MKATRIQYNVTQCRADACKNRFIPARKGHKYCSERCATYMRVKRWRKNGKS